MGTAGRTPFMEVKTEAKRRTLSGCAGRAVWGLWWVLGGSWVGHSWQPAGHHLEARGQVGVPLHQLCGWPSAHAPTDLVQCAGQSGFAGRLPRGWAEVVLVTPPPLWPCRAPPSQGVAHKEHLGVCLEDFERHRDLLAPGQSCHLSPSGTGTGTGRGKGPVSCWHLGGVMIASGTLFK